MSTTNIDVKIQTEPMMIATTRTNNAEDIVVNRSRFEEVFLDRAKGLYFPHVPAAERKDYDLPAGIAAMLLRKRVSDDTYDMDNTQDLFIGWCMAVIDGAHGEAASAYRAQLEAQLRLSQAEVARLKVSLQAGDGTFKRKVFWTRVQRLLERFQAFIK